MMEEDSLDNLGANDDEAGVGLTLDGIDLLDVRVQESRRLSVITPEMMAKSVRHVRTAKAQRQYLWANLLDARLDSNINANHSDKHYVFICDYAQNIELPFLGDTQSNLLTSSL